MNLDFVARTGEEEIPLVDTVTAGGNGTVPFRGVGIALHSTGLIAELFANPDQYMGKEVTCGSEPNVEYQDDGDW